MRRGARARRAAHAAPPHRRSRSLHRFGRSHASTRVCSLPLSASRRGAPASRSRRYFESAASSAANWP
jgi:hypothetical protein